MRWRLGGQQRRSGRIAAAAVVLLAVVAWAGAAQSGSHNRDVANAGQLGTRLNTLRPRSFSVAATGDILPHSALWRDAAANAAYIGRPGYDYRPMFRTLAPLIAPADLAICHLETPIAPWGEAFTTAPHYGVQPEIIEAIAFAGYDRCSTASNHSLDRGTAGVDRTVDEFAAQGVGQSGMARFPAEIEPQVFFVDGIAVSHLSYTFSYNGLRPPPGQEWRSALIDPGRIVADAYRARELGAEVVIVSMHWGTERSHHVDAFQRQTADAITRPGVIDLVIGHHAHVLQPIEQVNGTWVWFGAGNVLSDMPTTRAWPAASQDAAVLETDITVEADGRVTVARPKIYPTWVSIDGGHGILPVQSTLANPQLSPDIRRALEASLGRTWAVLGGYIAPEP